MLINFSVWAYEPDDPIAEAQLTGLDYTFDDNGNGSMSFMFTADIKGISREELSELQRIAQEAIKDYAVNNNFSLEESGNINLSMAPRQEFLEEDEDDFDVDYPYFPFGA